MKPIPVFFLVIIVILMKLIALSRIPYVVRTIIIIISSTVYYFSASPPRSMCMYVRWTLKCLWACCKPQKINESLYKKKNTKNPRNYTIRLPIYDFLLKIASNFTTYKPSNVSVTLTLTLQGYPRWNVMGLLGSPYVISCWYLIVTHGLTGLLCKI